MARRCTYCRTELPAKKNCATGYQREGFCDIDCMSRHGLEKARVQQRRKAEREAKAKRAKHRADKERIKTKPQLIKEAQAEFNKFIRLRDYDQPCICCGEFDDGTEAWKPGGAYDAGHFLSVGSHPELRFTEENCYRQKKSCNAGEGKYRGKGRQVSERYEERLRELKGDDLVDWLQGPHEMPNWTHDDLRAIRDKYRAKCRQLKREINQ